MSNKKIVLLSILLIVFLSISAVNAFEISENADGISYDDKLDIIELDDYSIGNSSSDADDGDGSVDGNSSSDDADGNTNGSADTNSSTGVDDGDVNGSSGTNSSSGVDDGDVNGSSGTNSSSGVDDGDVNGSVDTNSSSGSTTLKNNTSNEVRKITITPYKLSTTYGSGRYFQVKVIDSKTKKPIPNLKLILKVYTGKKYKKITKTSNSKGIIKYYASTLAIGKHKVIISPKNSKKFISKSKIAWIKISKAKLIISAPKATNYYKYSEKFQIKVLNKNTKKEMKNIKVTFRVYTGKKYKTYTKKTNKNGIVYINTKSLKKGTHKVTINIKKTAKIYAASRKSSIKIVSAPKIIKLKVNNHTFNVKLVDNSATKSLINRLKKGNIIIHAEDYGNFEKVGDLGFSLPSSDKYITTSAGDIVLYNDDEISLFYNSNSWSYTKLGKIQNTNSKDLKEILGSGNVVLIFSLK